MPAAGLKPGEGRLRITLPTGIFPPDIGGPASYVPRIAEALTARGHTVEVITLADDPAVDGHCPFPVRRIRRGRPRIPRMIETVAAVAGSARKSDLIYANGLFIEAAAAAAITRKPLVMKIVGDWAWERARNARVGERDMVAFQSRRQPLRFELVKALRSAVSRRADRIIVASRFFAGVIAGWGIPAARLAIIPNALDPFPDGPAKPLPPFHGRTLVALGRLVPLKRIDALIRWLSERNGYRLLIVGDGPERSALERLAVECGVQGRALFAGSVAHARVAGYLRAADAMVVHSAYETFCYSVIEGFLAGVPVVACASGAIPELIDDGESGLLYPPDKLDSLSAQLERLFSDPGLRATLIEGGRRVVKDRFRWDALVERTEALLSEAARNAGDGR
jgi:glycosyltransferase involved in cell wall biosynthesis